MIPTKYGSLVFSFIMSLFMSAVMSLAMLSLELQTFGGVLENWPKSWAIAMLVAFPASIIVVPFARRLVSKIVASN